MAKGLSINGGEYTKPAATPLTKMQEDASLAVIRMAFAEGREWKEEEIVGDGKTKGSLLEFEENGKPRKPTKVQQEIFKVFPSKHMNDYEWLKNFYKQQAKFFGVRFGNHTVRASSGGYQEYDRDNPNGFMQYIEGVVKTNFGISKKDIWNPADIWLVWDSKQAKANIESNIVNAQGSKDINQLNAALRVMLREHQIIGISLKKISGKTAKWEVLNLTKKFTFIGAGPPKYEWANRKAKCKCKLVTGKFATGEKGLEWYQQLTALESNPKFIKGYADLFVRGQPLPEGLRRDGNTVTPARVLAWQSQQFEVLINENRNPKYLLPIKSGHTGGAKGDKLSFEPVDVHATAARLGKAEASKVVSLFQELGSANAHTFNRWQDYPSTLADWNQTQRSKYTAIVNRITPWVEVGVTGRAFSQNVTTLFKQVELIKTLEIPQEKLTSNRLRFAIVAKLMQVVVANMLWNLNQRKFPKNTEVTLLEVWLTKIAFMAQKKGPGFGPFGKLY